MFKENFIKLCNERKIPPTVVCQSIGLTAATFSKWDEKSVPRKATLYKLADYFGVTPQDLLSDQPLPSRGDAVPLDPSGVYMAPLYESVSAGFGAYAADLAVDRVPIYVTKAAEAAETICIRVSGDSMFPIIANGDIVQVRKQDSVISGSVAVVMVEDEGFVKNVYYEEGKWLELRSENDAYPPMRFEGRDISRVRVVGFVTKVIKNVNAHVDAAPDDSKQRLDALLESMDQSELEQFLAFADAYIRAKKK